MASFKNEGIESITMKIPNIKSYCPLGNSYYTLNFEVLFIPDEIIPDYLDITKWLEDNIKSKELTIEDATLLFKEYLLNTFAPYFIKINTDVSDAAHFPVIVTVSY